MMKYEFEALAGYEVSNEDYNNIIEPMYMATELSKQDFVKCIDKKRFALPTKKQIINQMKKIAQHLMETCEHYTDYKAKDELDKIAKAYAKRFYGLDWTHDTKVYAIFLSEYFFKEAQRGCTYPNVLVIGRGDREYERINLI